LSHENTRPLICLGGLAVIGMAAWQQYSRDATFESGQAQVRGDMMIGPALVNNLLDAKAVALQRAHHFGVQRRLIRKSAQRLPELPLQKLLAFMDFLRSFQVGHYQAAGVEVFLR